MTLYFIAQTPNKSQAIKNVSDESGCILLPVGKYKFQNACTVDFLRSSFPNTDAWVYIKIHKCK